ncbi:3-oxo-5-alpha-steroid 4-dehydrogenase family protein [Trichophyton interdigitale]|uniref:3-oxo-5-alpha-steroid 4-dehydrogenase family protein n=1 Tax=Trichophyton interdigitale TaxID=101480 RepID=A0A9P5CVT1_9EURO|nr:3-oxo-5-alpha-steroid 4-dehydrogenase family protein [Trichophyton interdigitale]KAF3895952.1 3-oxo-5-alpha-steroid 4-dehydrogenase family protein [Trichophyton interdigitale]KAG8207927.1 3-oxo-5-alpha-steroid 4-dehydrogenase family protein [Trichophyton interdigitale]
MDTIIESVTEWVKSLPPRADFFPVTQPAYAVLITVFQYFLVAPILQLLTPYYPQGKTSISKSYFNLPGRYTWCIMESFGMANFIYIISTSEQGNGFSGLSTWHKVLAVLYVLHYVNRALITPLFLAPSMSPIHIEIFFFSILFHYLASSIFASWLLGYKTVLATAGTPEAPGAMYDTTIATAPELKGYMAYAPYIGLAIFLVGMYGNIQSENTLFELRKEEAHRRQKKQDNSAAVGSNGKSIYDKVYVLPPAEGYFSSILFPHYALEWIEWTGFVIIALSVTTINVASITAESAASTGVVQLAPFYAPVAKFFMGTCGLPLPFPILLICVNIMTTTAVRARWGRTWYIERFGEKAVGGRGAFVPYCKWL